MSTVFCEVAYSAAAVHEKMQRKGRRTIKTSVRRREVKVPVGKKIGFSVPSLLTLVLFSVIMALSFCEVRLFAALRGADSPFTNGGHYYEIFTQAFIR